MRKNETVGNIPLTLINEARRNSKSYHVIEKKVFIRLMEVEKLSRKKCKDIYNISNQLFNKSLGYHYTPQRIEELRRAKIMGTLVGIRPVKWRERAKVIENYFPGLIKAIEDNKLKLALNKLDKANDLTYDLKEAVRLVHKHIRGQSKRKGITVNFVANALEYKVKKIIISLGLKYKTQYPLENRFYDFKIIGKKLLIEVDGKQHHTKTSNIPKDELAKKYGYRLIRIKEKDIKNVHYIKDKINKALRDKTSL